MGILSNVRTFLASVLNVERSEPLSVSERADVQEYPSSGVISGQRTGFQQFLLSGNVSSDAQQAAYRRYQLLREMRRISDSDPRVSRILHKLSSDASHGGYSVVVESASGRRERTRAQGIIDRTRHLIRDEELLRGWIEALLRDGDLFLQVLVDGMSEVVRVKKLAAEMTFTRMNAEGEFPEDRKPYFQARGLIFDEVVREFDAWEIVHAKWRAEDGRPYGTPLFASAQKTMRRVDSGEEDMSVRRKLRSGLRFFFNIGTPENPGSWEEVERFKEQNRDTLENPVNAISNIYGNGLTDMKALQGDTQLGNKEDIAHFEGLLSMVGLTPSALLSGGRERSTNMNVINAEEEDYVRTLESICKVAESFLRPIFNVALYLKGINPDALMFSFNWGAKDRESIDKKMARALAAVRLGFSHETAFTIADLDNGLTYEDELQRIEEQVARGLIPYKGPFVSSSVEPVAGDANREAELDQDQQTRLDVDS